MLSCKPVSSHRPHAARSELDDLPVLATYPLREQAAATRQIAQSGSGPSVTVFPLGGLSDCPGVLELGTAEPMPEESRRLVTGVLRLYLNFQGLLDYGERDALTELLNRKSFDSAFMKATIAQQLTSINAQGERRVRARRQGALPCQVPWTKPGLQLCGPGGERRPGRAGNQNRRHGAVLKPPGPPLPLAQQAKHQCPTLGTLARHEDPAAPN